MSTSASGSQLAGANSARMIDYWLGGRHYLPVDVDAAKEFEAAYGDFRGMFRVLRRFIGRATRSIRAQGIDQLIVFGAGLPTSGNVHEVVPDARVLYTDMDPTNISMGREILADLPNADYIYCDASDLTTLDQASVERVLGPIRRLGIVFVGVAAFISDDKLKAAFASLYDWAPPGSTMALDFDSEMGLQYPKIVEMLEAPGLKFHMRSPEAIRALLGPWRLTDDGITPVSAWRNQGEDADYPAFMYGCMVHRPDDEEGRRG
ncbi:SAM-dependent methyltransferase [Sorangium sp. So ce1014]|uniref:SAM-dependent methyltransferase n=1 Tax=Sorangium sp. So ce1014 TaxID=3133326 RepID=UPI003F6089D4